MSVICHCYARHRSQNCWHWGLFVNKVRIRRKRENWNAFRGVVVVGLHLVCQWILAHDSSPWLRVKNQSWDSWSDLARNLMSGVSSLVTRPSTRVRGGFESFDLHWGGRTWQLEVSKSIQNKKFVRKTFAWPTFPCQCKCKLIIYI